ncbi:MAG TPA: hypothetical protein VH000_01405, partial [Rhizomicrobium sp.]|nr:hypothetical protein [Rhizomicrobium sp.]
MNETLRKFAETMTGIGRPRAAEIVLRSRKPHVFQFADDGQTPNNPRFPLIVYRSPVKLAPASDPAAIFEELFAAHGWEGSWRDGIYDFLHFHSHSHEVLGIARGKAKVQFGGRKGRTIELAPGDVAILP